MGQRGEPAQLESEAVLFSSVFDCVTSVADVDVDVPPQNTGAWSGFIVFESSKKVVVNVRNVIIWV